MRSFRESIKALEADNQYANTLSVRSQSCPFCRDAFKQVKQGDLWIYTDDGDIVDLSVIMKECDQPTQLLG